MSDIINQKTEQLIEVIQKLSLCRNIESIRDIVKHAARDLVQSDGATFVMRDNEHCFYVDEYAISPLWKGKRFPLSSCISGWAMINKKSVAISDIYQDDRIPHDAYRPTFVKSLVMVPIRAMDPIGAIGNYWQNNHIATPDEIKLLEALANSTSIAIENVTVYSELENRVKLRTAQLYATNQELEAFSYSVSHDLRAPLRAIENFSQMIESDSENKLTSESITLFSRIQKNATRMNELINDILQLSKIARTELLIEECNLSSICEEILSNLSKNNPDRKVKWEIQKDLTINADTRLLRILLENILSNAWKFTGKKSNAVIEVGSLIKDSKMTFYIRDNGAGFDTKNSQDLFRPFKRFHNEKDFPGTGIGLATVKRIVQLHDGEIQVESAENQGTTFYFTLKNE